MDARVKDRPTSAVMGLGPGGGNGLFAADRTAPREARRWVAAYFIAQGRADLVDDVKLVVSELVTNALRERALFRVEGDPMICVRIIRHRAVYRVEVYDGSPEAPPADPPAEDLKAFTGRGLCLVDASVAQRGWAPYVDQGTGTAGKCVWFTMLRTD